MAPSQLLKRMVKQAGNIDRPSEPYLREIMTWLDGWLWIFAAVGKRTVPCILETFEYARARYGCGVFVIDSLMRTGVSAEDYDAQEKAVFGIVTWATEKNVHVHLVAHARKGNRDVAEVPGIEDVKGTSEIAANAFNIIAVWRNRKLEGEIQRLSESVEHGESDAEAKRKAAAARAQLLELEGKPPVVCNVAKQRNGDWEGKFGLWFNQASYQYRDADDSREGQRYVAFSNVQGNAA
jgi:twinkle protein